MCEMVKYNGKMIKLEEYMDTQKRLWDEMNERIEEIKNSGYKPPKMFSPKYYR